LKYNFFQLKGFPIKSSQIFAFYYFVKGKTEVEVRQVSKGWLENTNQDEILKQ
jgi:hypothetical protein